MISEAIALFAVCVSFGALIFSWIVFRKDRTRDFQGDLFREKLIKYQSILKLGRFLVYDVKSSPSDIEKDEITASTKNLFNLSDECVVIAPPNLANNVLDFAFTTKELNKARINSENNKEEILYSKASEELRKFIVDAREDLGVGQLNSLLLERVGG